MKSLHIILFACLTLIPLGGCSMTCPYNNTCSSSVPAKHTPPPVTLSKTPYKIHVVQKGDTLWHISKHYNVSIQDLMAVNHLNDASHLTAGEYLIIPKSTYTKPARVSRYAAPSKAQQRASHKEGFIWPVKGKITAFFGKTKSKINKGITIAAPAGTPIKAIQSGKVIYSNMYGPFGNTVILRHANGFSSVYSHNRKNLVRKGQWVSQGQPVGTIGASGNVSTPCLHLEIRKKSKAINPLLFLRTP